jgi:hypothetical protein
MDRQRQAERRIVRMVNRRAWRERLLNDGCWWALGLIVLMAVILTLFTLGGPEACRTAFLGVSYR